ncbi:hypothetical protein CEXT_240621 [Caerostris extrusa]|uniref:Uncharacterized protein n=1 Tax=Caerostris extrusa TaxID=172846 RepID=A0AAV4QDQ4_CAEEX|nr:hypothetical protein CEXT_240621 [Caerostris extrusa]
MDVIRFGRRDYQSECGIGELLPPRFALEGLGTQKDKTRQRVEEYKSLPETLNLESTLHYGGRKKSVSPQHPSPAVGVRNADYSAISFASGV